MYVQVRAFRHAHEKRAKFQWIVAYRFQCTRCTFFPVRAGCGRRLGLLLRKNRARTRQENQQSDTATKSNFTGQDRTHRFETSQMFVKLYHSHFWNLVLVSLLLPGLRGSARLCYTSYMPDFAAPIERLIDELKHLPGI